MKSIQPAALLCLLALILAASPSAAQSDGYWQPGTGVRVGDVYFHVVSVAPNSEALFRVTERLDAPGVEEHPDCYRVSRTYYHLESCPAVQAHFRRHAGSADSSAPTAAPAGHSGGSHPINYLQGNYEAPSPPFWAYTGFWYTPWIGPGYGYGFGGARPLFRPRHGFGGRPAHRAGYGGPRRPGGYGGGFSYRFRF